MKLPRPLLIAIAVLAVAVGALWIGQGLGYVRWPAQSFMIDQSPWAWRGAALVVAGLAAALLLRR